MFRLEKGPMPSYQELTLARFEQQIGDAEFQLGKIYAGDKRSSDKDYAKLAKRLLRESAWTLFEMQLFPVIRVLDAGNPHGQEIINDCLLKFRAWDGADRYLDLEGTIFEPSGTSSIRDGGRADTTTLSKDFLAPVKTEGYRVDAKNALEALQNHARMHAFEIAAPRPIRSVADIQLPKAA